MTQTVAQEKGDRKRLQPFVSPETATRLRVWSSVWGKSQGELIDQLVQAHLPPVPLEMVKDEAA